MATNQTVERTIINKTPDVCGGDACIGNRRIPVWQLVECRNLGMSDERIMEVFDPPLTFADMEAAWQYYAENRHEIDEEIRLNAEAMLEEDE